MIYFASPWRQFSQVINVMAVIWLLHLSIAFSAGGGALCHVENSLFSHYSLCRSGYHYTQFLGKQTKA